MTREEAINVLNDYDINFERNTAEEVAEAHEMAIKVLQQESKTDKALNLLAEWVTDCDFGYDNIPEEYEKYKDDIAEMGYTEGLVYIVKKESEVQE